MKRCGVVLLMSCFGLAAQEQGDWADRPVPMKRVILANGAMWAGAGLDIATSGRQPECNRLLAGTDGKFGARGVGIKVGINGAVTAVSLVLAKKWPRTRRAMILLNGVAGSVQGAAGVSNLAR